MIRRMTEEEALVKALSTNGAEPDSECGVALTEDPFTFLRHHLEGVDGLASVCVYFAIRAGIMRNETAEEQAERGASKAA